MFSARFSPPLQDGVGSLTFFMRFENLHVHGVAGKRIAGMGRRYRRLKYLDDQVLVLADLVLVRFDFCMDHDPPSS